MIRLNIASGPNVFPDWINLDRDDVEETYLRHLRPLTPADVVTWPEEQRRLVEYIAAGRITFKRKDLREGFAEYADGSVDAIYCGQMIEHLNPLHEVPQFLAECYRMLKLSARIRFTTPDLDKLLDAYIDHEWSHTCMSDFNHEQPDYYAKAYAMPEDQLAYIMFGAGGTAEHYEGHMHLYTSRSLGQRLQAAGFKLLGPNKSGPFNDCIDKGMSHSFALEAVK